MELTLIPLPPAPPSAGGGAPAAPPPGEPAASGVLASDRPDFAELLAAELALSAGAEEKVSIAPDPQVAGLIMDPEAVNAPVTAVTDPAFTAILAAATLPAAPAPVAAAAPRSSAAAVTSERAMEAASRPADTYAVQPRAEPTAAATPAPATAAQESPARPAGAAPLPDISAQTPVTTGAAAPSTGSHHAGPAAAPAAAALRAPVGAEGWDAQLGRAMLWMAGERHQIADIRLNPPDLGPLEIHLRLTGEGGSQASVSFASPHAEVRAAIEAALPRLREMLAESGLSLGQASVNAESFRDSNDAPRAGGGGEPMRAASGSATPVPGAVPRAGMGLLDVFA